MRAASGHSLVTGSVHYGPALPASGGVPADCKPSCCRTPYGHSVVRDSFPKWHRNACHCHKETTE